MPTDWQELSSREPGCARGGRSPSPPALVPGRVRPAADRRLVPRGAVGNRPRARRSAKKPCGPIVAKNLCRRRGAGFWPATARCWPAIGKWRPWRSSIATWRSRRGRPGWNNWPASGCRKISVAMRPGWPRKCRSCGKSATNCTAAWLRCAASIFPSGRPGHAKCRTASSGSRPTPGGGRSKRPGRPRRRATMRRGPIGFSAALHEIFEPARDAVPETVTVAEELADHVLAEDIPAAAVAEIQQHAGTLSRHADRSPDPSDLSRRALWRRTCSGILAALNTLLAGTPSLAWSRVRPTVHEYVVGRTGIEQQCEALLRGQPGIGVEVTDHAGRVQQAFHETEPVAGRDVTLTIDPRLQRTAEELLDSALQRVALQSDRRRSRRAARSW